MHWQAFRLPKRGNTVEEYEDACHGDPARGRFAIADGATESSFAAQWARLLVEDFIQAEVHHFRDLPAWLPPLQQRWLKEVSGQPLPWYAEAKLKEGAFAAFLGVVVQHSPKTKCWNRWTALAVGDSCVFQIREGQLRRTFPVQKSEEFGTYPWLIGSRLPPQDLLTKRRVGLIQSSWQTSDRLWLMTDALAQWFLREHEADRRPWEAVEQVLAAATPDEAFTTWIEALRDAKAIKNDDVTLGALHLDDGTDLTP